MTFFTFWLRHGNIYFLFCFVFQVSLTNLQHLPLPLKLTCTQGTNTTPTVLWSAARVLFLLQPVRTLISVTWTCQNSALKSLATSMDSTSMSSTSTCPRTASAPVFWLRQIPAIHITIPQDHSPYPASYLTPTFPKAKPPVGLPLVCPHLFLLGTIMDSMRTPAKNLRLKLSRWVQVTTAAPPPPLLRLHNLNTLPSAQAPALPPPHHLPSASLSTLIFRAPVSTAPSLGILPVCISTRTSTPPEGPTPHHLSTAWPWRHLHTVLPLAGSNLSTQHSPDLEEDDTIYKKVKEHEGSFWTFWLLWQLTNMDFCWTVLTSVQHSTGIFVHFHGKKTLNINKD